MPLDRNVFNIDDVDEEEDQDGFQEVDISEMGPSPSPPASGSSSARASTDTQGSSDPRSLEQAPTSAVGPGASSRRVRILESNTSGDSAVGGSGSEDASDSSVSGTSPPNSKGVPMRQARTLRAVASMPYGGPNKAFPGVGIAERRLRVESVCVVETTTAYDMEMQEIDLGSDPRALRRSASEPAGKHNNNSNHRRSSVVANVREAFRSPAVCQHSLCSKPPLPGIQHCGKHVHLDPNW